MINFTNIFVFFTFRLWDIFTAKEDNFVLFKWWRNGQKIFTDYIAHGGSKSFRGKERVQKSWWKERADEYQQPMNCQKRWIISWSVARSLKMRRKKQKNYNIWSDKEEKNKKITVLKVTKKIKQENNISGDKNA